MNLSIEHLRGTDVAELQRSIFRTVRIGDTVPQGQQRRKIYQFLNDLCNPPNGGPGILPNFVSAECSP